MKKIFTLAIIALASVSMVACCGQAEKKECCPNAEAQTEVTCDKNCAECPKAAECPEAKAAEAAAPAAEAPAAPAAETPAK
jgi:hypothetical protein